VESEFRLKLKDDSRREWEIFSEQVNPLHPLAKFSVGNSETLADRDGRPVVKDLKHFYKKYYSADLMTLVVLGKESLTQLEQEVRSRFSTIPSHAGSQRAKRPSKHLDNLALQIPLPSKLLIKPVKDERSLSVAFPVPRLTSYWRTKPDIYWGHILGDESEGSLIAQLKTGGLANGLAAGLAFDTEQGALFVVKIALTPEGVERSELVLDRLFAWLHLAGTDGINQWRFEELARIQQTRFRFLPKSAPMSYVQHLSTELRKYPPEEVLRGAYVLSQFDRPMLSDFIKRLVSDNAVIMMVAPEVANLDRISARYAAPYRIETIDKETRERWAGQTDDKLKLAPTNTFLATNYPVSDKNGTRTNPVKLASSHGDTIWHYADQQFGSPSGLFEARILMAAINSCRRQAQVELYLAMVVDAMAEQSYQASLAGLNYSVHRLDNGISVDVTGYAERQEMMLNQVLTTMTTLVWNPEDFHRISGNLLRKWRNSRKQWPVRQLMNQLGPLIKGSCDQLSLADELETVTLNEMPVFVNKIFEKTQTQFYGGGVLSADQILAMASTTSVVLGTGKTVGADFIESVVSLPEHSITHSVGVDHADHSVILYIQGDEDTLRERALMAMLKTVFSAPFYTTMRTEKQHGYVVGVNISHINRVPGIALYIQSPGSSATVLEKEIGGFVKDFRESIEAINESDLRRFKNSLLTTINQQSRNIFEEAARHQEALYLGFDKFQFREALAEQVKKIDLQSLLEAYQRLCIDGSRRLWLVTEHGDKSGKKLKHDDLLTTSEKVFVYPL
jgi:secreted Zn-dependent insulinase-like peptidase